MIVQSAFIVSESPGGFKELVRSSFGGGEKGRIYSDIKTADNCCVNGSIEVIFVSTLIALINGFRIWRCGAPCVETG